MFVEAKTYRYQGHMIGDPEIYRTKEEVAAWRARDPIERLGQRLLQDGVSEKTLAGLRDHAREEIARAAREAEESPEPELSDALSDVF